MGLLTNLEWLAPTLQYSNFSSLILFTVWCVIWYVICNADFLILSISCFFRFRLFHFAKLVQPVLRHSSFALNRYQQDLIVKRHCSYAFLTIIHVFGVLFISKQRITHRSRFSLNTSSSLKPVFGRYLSCKKTFHSNLFRRGVTYLFMLLKTLNYLITMSNRYVSRF